mmetsp:Transcript_20783/g.48200  ORF Transcript_20783/g.48200 Transcript_20783/m.48200 type:complete len:271 (-) Transcript_20783:656-1468(-)
MSTERTSASILARSSQTQRSPPSSPVSRILSRRPLASFFLPSTGCSAYATKRFTSGVKPATLNTFHFERVAAGFLIDLAYDMRTARSIGSSVDSPQATAAASMTCSLVKPFQVRMSLNSTVMSAVVRVPVLSEQSTVMAAMSWSAGKLVTIAFCSAMLAAPRAMVIWITIGSATGTEAMMSERQSTISDQKSLPRYSHWTQITQITSMRVKMIRYMTTLRIFSSNADTCFCESPAIRRVALPDSVFAPTFSTRRWVPGDWCTTQPARTSL